MLPAVLVCPSGASLCPQQSPSPQDSPARLVNFPNLPALAGLNFWPLLVYASFPRGLDQQGQKKKSSRVSIVVIVLTSGFNLLVIVELAYWVVSSTYQIYEIE